jgi:hypothetical protein
MEVELAAYTTVCAGSADSLRFGTQTFRLDILFRNKGTHRAGLNAFSAENAIGILECSVAPGNDLGSRASIAVTDRIIYLDFIAGLNTATAKDTTGKVAEDKGIYIFDRVQGLTRGEAMRLYLVPYCQILQTTLSISGTQILVLFSPHSLQLKIGPRLHIHFLDKAIVIS